VNTLNYQSPQDGRHERRGILRQLFGPSREEVWRQLAEVIGARYVDGGFWRGDKVVARVGQWEVTLDTFEQSQGEGSTTYTRLRAPYVNADGFRFRVYRTHLFSQLGELFGMQDIQVGDRAFDEMFVVKSNDERKVRALLKDEAIRNLLKANPNVFFEVKDDEGYFGASFPEGVDELHLSAAGVIKDIDRLRGLYSLFALALNRLCHIGSAYEDDPGIRL
jgi:hypothetical protein